MSHVLEFFTAHCPLCDGFQDQVELGKCGPCKLRIRDTREPRTRRLMKKYGVRVVPTLVIDGRIKVEGPLREPWICGDEFYEMLERKYPLLNARPTPGGTGSSAGSMNA